MSESQEIPDDSQLAALLQWRNDLIDTGAVSRSSFKEAHLRLVLRSGRTEVDQIRAMLPAPVAEHAEEMARVLRWTSGQAGPDDETAVPTPPPATDAIPQSGFAPYVFGGHDHETAEVSVRPTDVGDHSDARQVSWPAFVGDEDAGCVIYRLVSSDGDRVYSPDKSHLVEATTLTTVIDDRLQSGVVRYLQVWVNTGDSLTAALAAQPVLHATGIVIATPFDVEVREDSGSVVGRWKTLPGVSAVHVYRIPAELAERAGMAFRIAADDANLTGFVDRDADSGRRYVYRARCEVQVDGIVRLSEAVEREIVVSAVLEPVTDLAIRMHDERGGVAFDLQWTAPRFGQVRVFRTAEAPSPDAHLADLDESVLEQAGLSRDTQLMHPVAERINEHGIRTSVMAQVPWPAGWNRAYITPATILDGRVRLGKPISTVRTGRIADVALMEYCNKEILTFDWPQGAAAVTVHIAPTGHNAEDGLTGRSYEITQDDYEMYGGMQFAGELPSHGCSLHLVPLAFSGGRRVFGSPTSTEYGGLLRLWYDVEVSRGSDGLPLHAAVRLRAQADATGSPPFVLVNNPERMPLSIDDGRPVDMFPAGSEDGPDSPRVKEFQWSSLTTTCCDVWCGDVRGLRGWIRLFANLPPQRLRLLALLDPPVEALRLTAGTRPQ